MASFIPQSTEASSPRPPVRSTLSGSRSSTFSARPSPEPRAPRSSSPVTGGSGGDRTPSPEPSSSSSPLSGSSSSPLSQSASSSPLTASSSAPAGVSNSPKPARSPLGAEARIASISSHSLRSVPSSDLSPAQLRKSLSVSELPMDGQALRASRSGSIGGQSDASNKVRLPSPPSVAAQLKSVFNERIDFHPAEMDVSGSLVPIALSVCAFEVQFTRQFKKPKYFFVRLDIGRQTCRGASAISQPGTLSKVIWPEQKLLFYNAGLSSDASLTVTLQTTVEDNKEKIYGKTSLGYSALGRAGTCVLPLNRERGKSKSKKSKTVVGQIVLFVQPYVSSFLLGYDHFAIADAPDVLLAKPAAGGASGGSSSSSSGGGSELVSYCSMIKSLTSDKAVSILASDVFIDPLFQLTYFLFFLEFGTLTQFVDELQQLYARSTTRVEQQTRIVALLETFLRDFFHIFFFIPNPIDELDVLRAFIRTTLSQQYEAQSKQLLLLCKHAGQMVLDRRAEGPCGSLECNPPYQWSPNLKTEFAGPSLSFAQLDPDNFAEQLTIIEAQIFRAVQPHEFARWHYDDHSLNSPALDYLTRHFNNVSLWIQTEISFQTRLVERSEVLRRAMLIAIALAKLNNFNGLMEILSAINSSSIRRMNRTFQSIDKPLLARFNKTAQIMAHEGNFRTYRKLLSSLPRGTPAVPYVGVFLTDLRFIMDGSPSKSSVDVDGVARQHINWQKFAKATDIISYLRKIQDECLYPSIAPNQQFQEWLLSRSIASAEECYQMSRRVDPVDYEKLVEEFIVQEKKFKELIAALEAGGGRVSALSEGPISEGSEYSVDELSFDRFYSRLDGTSAPADDQSSEDTSTSGRSVSPFTQQQQQQQQHSPSASLARQTSASLPRKSPPETPPLPPPPDSSATAASPPPAAADAGPASMDASNSSSTSTAASISTAEQSTVQNLTPPVSPPTAGRVVRPPVPVRTNSGLIQGLAAAATPPPPPSLPSLDNESPQRVAPPTLVRRDSAARPPSLNRLPTPSRLEMRPRLEPPRLGLDPEPESGGQESWSFIPD